MATDIGHLEAWRIIQRFWYSYLYIEFTPSGFECIQIIFTDLIKNVFQTAEYFHIAKPAYYSIFKSMILKCLGNIKERLGWIQFYHHHHNFLGLANYEPEGICLGSLENCNDNCNAEQESSSIFNDCGYNMSACKEC